jgi:serine/threonine-protein kinase
VPDAVTADRLLDGRYRLIRELARGGLAALWEAEDGVLGRRVAVKVLHPHLAGDEEFRERFRQEAIGVARLSHPAVVSIYDTGRDGSVSYLVTELVEGQTLAAALAERAPLPVDEAADLALQLAEGLAEAHARGIVHRAIQPGNVLVTDDGRAKLTDFGMARGAPSMRADEDRTEVGALDAARYLAPEQVTGQPPDARTDVYALGLVLYEMLTGRSPFHGDGDVATATARLDQPPRPPSQFRAEVARSLETLVLRALARDPAERFADAGELRDGLLALGLGSPSARRPSVGVGGAGGPQGSPIHDTPPAGLAAVTAPGDRRFTLSVVVVVVLGVAAAAAGVLAGTETGRSVLERVRDRLPGGAASSLSVVAVHDWDPFGDGGENPDDVGLVLDGDRRTGWSTEEYHEPREEFGNLKPGLGLRLDLEGPKAVEAVTVWTDGSPWSAEVYVGDGSAASLGEWGAPAGSAGGLGERGRIDVGGAEGRSVLLWITRLPPTGRIGILEIDVVA